MEITDFFGYLSNLNIDNSKNKPTHFILKNGNEVTGDFFMCNQASELMIENRWIIITKGNKEQFRLSGDDVSAFSAVKD